MLATATAMHAATVDFSVVSVPEESGLELTKISVNSDFVCLPKVKRTGKRVDWFTNRVLSLMPNTNNIAYLSVSQQHDQHISERPCETRLFAPAHKPHGSDRFLLLARR